MIQFEGTPGMFSSQSDMHPAASVTPPPRELDHRTSDGIHVQLLWHPHDNHVSVVVKDTKAGEAFELEVHPDQQPLDVYHHPYAYATEASVITLDHRAAAAR